MTRDTIIGLIIACIATVLLGSACTALLDINGPADPAGAQEAPPPTLEQVLIWAAGTSAYGKCVRAHESDTAGGYTAQNRVSTASGAFQFVDGTWRSEYARLKRGPSPWKHAKDAPPHIQNLVFATAVAHGGWTHWKGTGCQRYL
jgi:hypothetical protein